MPYILKLHVVNKELLPYYEEQIKKRRESAKTNPLMDSGFDLYCPEDVYLIMIVFSKTTC